VKIVATLNTAFFSGIYSGIAGYFLGPWIDHGGAIGIVIGILILILPVYFFIFGTERRKGGRWHLDVETLKRMGAWFIGVTGVGVTLQILQVVIHGVS
jgi:hypothetical protein